MFGGNNINNIYVLSDLEGYQIPNVENNNDEEIYICGDLTDSTAFLNNIGVVKKKVFNLNNIKRVVQNNKIHLLLGNRDINKIKVKLLSKLQNPDKKTKITNFNSGNINFSFKTYQDIKNEIKSTDPTKPTNPFYIKNMNSWYTFWSDSIGKGKNWSVVPDYTTFPFLTRFLEIFGVDNAAENGGTMSAQNLLFTIPSEVIDKITDHKSKPSEVIDKITDDKSKNVNDFDLELKMNEDNDYRAFIVLAVYYSMLSNPKNTPKASFSPSSSSHYYGLLYNLFTRSNLCEIKEIKNNIFIFSHGGITELLLNNWNILKNELNSPNNNLLSDYSILKLKGGNLFTNTNQAYTFNDVKTKINEINTFIKKIIIESLDYEGDKPSQELLLLLKLSSPYSCKMFESKITNSINCSNNFVGDLYSPIMPGLRIMREEYFFIEGKSVYQFFGHQPVGFSNVIEKFTNKNKNNSYLINLDTSISFSASPDNNFTSINYIIIESNGTLKNKSNINHNLKILPNPVNYNKDFFNYNKSQNGQLITDNENISNEITIDKEINNSDLETFNWLNTQSHHKSQLNVDEDALSNVYFNYHGRTKINDADYVVFCVCERANPKRIDANGLPYLNRVVPPPKFGKTYYILSVTEFNQIYNVIKLPKQLKSAINPSKQLKSWVTTVITANKLKSPSKQQNFKEKYLKYKSKYLALKNNL